MSSQRFNTRGVFNQAKAAMEVAGLSPAKAILSQSYLRLEVVLSTNVTQYQFGVLINESAKGGTAQGSVRPTEQRLNLQDAFYVGGVQLLIGLATSATDTAFPCYTWNNPLIFVTSGAATALNNLYNGYLSLSVNNVIIATAWDCLRHFVANQTQTGMIGGTGGITGQDQRDLGSDAMYPSEPNWVLIGSKNNNLTINMPGAISTLQASATTVLVLMLRGVLAQNVTTVV